jgi:hypothetical protein
VAHCFTAAWATQVGGVRVQLTAHDTDGSGRVSYAPGRCGQRQSRGRVGRARPGECPDGRAQGLGGRLSGACTRTGAPACTPTGRILRSYVPGPSAGHTRAPEGGGPGSRPPCGS